jgi:isopenicillin N synthase-like dioxygenase
MTFTEIPTVDLDDYRNGDAATKAAFVKKLGDSFSNIGFAIVANHGVSDEVIDNAYQSFQAFFALPDEVKGKYEDPAIAGQRGYISKGKEHAKGRNVGDLKEFYHIGQIVADDDPIQNEYPDNIFPDAEAPGVRQYGVALYQSLEESGRYLLRAIAEYLGLPVHYFDDKIHNGNSILRPIHYYAIENPDEVPEGAVRAAEHEDINLITLLIGASADGLQALNKNGDWIDAKPKPNEIVINVGDMLQRLTNNKLKSTTHRVVNPPRDQMNKPRYSVPFFLHPRSDMDLTCLESCVDEEHPKIYSDMTAGEYLDERLREIGLKK